MLTDLNALAGRAMEKRRDGYWITLISGELPALAAALLDSGARLTTVTAQPEGSDETRLIYHFVLQAQALNLQTSTHGNHIASLAATYPAASWIEREIHDLYAVQFDGHPNLARLLLPPELPVGLFRQPAGAPAKRSLQEKESQAYGL